MSAIAVRVRGGDGFLIELREQNVRDCVMDRFRRMFEKVGEAHVQATLAEPDRCVQRRETAEANVEVRDRRTGTEVAILLLKDGDERGVHYGSRLTWRRVDEFPVFTRYVGL